MGLTDCKRSGNLKAWRLDAATPDRYRVLSQVTILKITSTRWTIAINKTPKSWSQEAQVLCAFFSCDVYIIADLLDPRTISVHSIIVNLHVRTHNI